MNHRVSIFKSFLFAAACSLFFVGQIKAGLFDKPAKASFLTVQEARLEIINDADAPYFKNLEPLEMSAKTGSPITGSTREEMQKECMRRYQEGVLDFTPAEKELLSWVVEKIFPDLQKKYPDFAKIPWNFLKVSDSIEGGLPHTRGKHIIVSPSLLSDFLARKKTEPPMALIEVGNLLIHEQTHIAQRLKPDLFASLYKEWGFKKVSKIESSPWLMERHLVNPDGIDCTWIYPVKSKGSTTWILPLVIFKGIPPEGTGVCKMPEDFRSIGLELEENTGRYQIKLDSSGKPVFKDLMQIYSYIQKFNGAKEVFHPHEISADLFAQIVIFDLFAPKPQMKRELLEEMERAFTPLRDWFTKNFK